MEEIVDTQSSFYLWTTLEGNSVGRWDVESLCVVEGAEFVLLSGVMACDVYGDNPLFLSPAYMYQGVFSSDKCKVFRTYNDNFTTTDTFHRIGDIFADVRFDKRHTLAQRLNSFAEISEAVLNGQKFICVAQYIVEDQEIIQTFSVKHINLSASKRQFQIETGPLLIWTGNFENSSLGYIAFNEFGVLNTIDKNSKITSHKAHIKLYTK